MKRNFTTEVDKVLRLVVHSIYTNKEIFLRELISNASDACDKLKYELLQNDSNEHSSSFKIQIIAQKDHGVLIINDNGIGMDEEDLINNLGTIASSGTQKFLEQHAGDKAQFDLIGQFGVGFYSAFMVSDSVTVYSRKFRSSDIYQWHSDGSNGYTINKLSEKESCEHLIDGSGTSIQLKLNPEYIEFLEKYKLQHIIKTYSDHIAFPIELIDSESSASIINASSALWLQTPSSVIKEQYHDFYKYISHSPDEPWLIMHNKIEGNVSYTNLLFIPTNKPFDLFRPQAKSRTKLYVKRVFITDESINIVPSYMRFLCGIIDSEDLPLNISRETLQNNLVITKIRKSIVKKVLTTLKKKVEESLQEYELFWSNFGEVLKEGLCEGAFEDKELLLDVCRFHTLNSPDKTISFDDYISNMIEGQNDIYYITGNNTSLLRNHPQLQGFKERGIDVLLLTDHVDDFWVNVVNQYKNHILQSAISANIDLQKLSDKSNDAIDQLDDKDSNKVISYIKTALGDKVRDVKVSTKLIENPVCLSIPEGTMNIRMEKMLIEQKQLNKKSTKILEININHSLIKTLADYIESKHNKADMIVNILFGQACILEGEDIEDPYLFINQINKCIA